MEASPQEIADVFDAWEQTLTPAQKEWCRKAIKNLNGNLRNMGGMSAKELIIAVLLFYDRKQPK